MTVKVSIWMRWKSRGADADDRFGIRGMKERAALIGGRLEISSQAGQGTSVRLTAPVEGQEDGTCPDL